MNKITNDDLVLLYYGEHEDPTLAATVAKSAELSARFDALCAELKLVDAFVPPERSDDFGARTWQQIATRLADEPSPEPGRLAAWLQTLGQPRFSLAGVFSIAIAAGLAFWMGRSSGPETNGQPEINIGHAPALVASVDSSRLLKHSVSGHLGDVNLMLTRFANESEPAPDAAEWATDMLVSNRLYRRAAASAGDTQLANFLTELEPLLIELAYESYKNSSTTRDRLQQEVNDGMLFKVRVMNKQLEKQNDSI
jgi:hypothetical protein